MKSLSGALLFTGREAFLFKRLFVWQTSMNRSAFQREKRLLSFRQSVPGSS